MFTMRPVDPFAEEIARLRATVFTAQINYKVQQSLIAALDELAVVDTLPTLRALIELALVTAR